jgi:hypothetical protein
MSTLPARLRPSSRPDGSVRRPRDHLIITVQYGKADFSLGGVTNNEEDAISSFSRPLRRMHTGHRHKKVNLRS